MDTLAADWSPEHRALWERIAAHAFENDGIALDFTRRLARTLGWPLDDTRALVEEYRRFGFLACVADIGPVTPSEEVDEVWHLHLAYTRDYWDRWCGEALRRRLHHDPTAGGPAEQARYREQYAATLALYERWFGPPPEAFWPGTARRFAARPRFRMVDTRRGWIAPRLPWRAASLAAALVSAATPARASDWLEFNPLDYDGPTFLTFYAALALLVAMLTWLLRDTARTSDRRPDLRDLGDVDLAYCTGGDARAADTLYVALASRGAASLGMDGIVVDGPVAGTPMAVLPPELDAFRRALVGARTRAGFLSAFADSSPYRTMLGRLDTRKILLDPRRRARLALATWLPAALLVAFGFAKVGVGVARGKPVGFLLLFMAVTAVAAFVVLRRERYLTREARASIESLRGSRGRALRAPRPEELPFAFAMLGAVALDGTAHAGYARLLKAQAGGDGGSGCGSDGGGSGGDGGGSGGGCGGCGS